MQHRRARALFLALLAAVVSACQTAPVIEDAQATVDVASLDASDVSEPAPEIQRDPPPPDDLWERIRPQLVFNTLDNAQVDAARDYYLEQPRHLELIAPRAERYLYYLVTEVEKRRLPIELALLPMVESALNPFAYSGQRAAGLWQIMPGTADDLGVQRDWWYDGRLDLRESTRHALDHLEALNSEFDGDWLLTLAAYNAGKYRVRSALKRNREAGKNTDFWSLKLPQETRRYVPRLIAISSLIASDEALGVTLPPVPNRPVFAPIDTGGQIEMLRLAQLSGLNLTELRRFNPGQLRWATAPREGDEILLPLAVAGRARTALAELPADQRVTWEHYRIRQGDSLIRIARRFDTQVGLLREVNKIRGNMIRAGDTVMIPNSDAWEQSLALASAGTAGVKRDYKVRSGDSLYVIAQRFDVTVDDIIGWNKIDPQRYLKPGQALTLFLAAE